MNPCLYCGGIPVIEQQEARCACGRPAMWHDRWDEMNPIDAKQIMRNQLKKIGADGLRNQESFAGKDYCWCCLADIAHCGYIEHCCTPGFAAHGVVNGNYYIDAIYPTRRAAEEARSKAREELEA